MLGKFFQSFERKKREFSRLEVHLFIPSRSTEIWSKNIEWQLADQQMEHIRMQYVHNH